jgi:hypothetical protein
MQSIHSFIQSIFHLCKKQKKLYNKKKRKERQERGIIPVKEKDNSLSPSLPHLLLTPFAFPPAHPADFFSLS